MKPTLTLFAAFLLALASPGLSAADLALIENRQPHVEIVVAEKWPRMVTLAAVEFRLFWQKMSGARLPIVTAPTARVKDIPAEGPVTLQNHKDAVEFCNIFIKELGESGDSSAKAK